MAWDTNTLTAYFNYDRDVDDDLIFTNESNIAIVNGETITMNHMAVIAKSGAFSIPVQDLFSLFGESTWSKENGVVTATLSIPKN